MALKRHFCLSAFAVGLVVFTGIPAAATCVMRPNLQTDGGYWRYRTDRQTNRKCWYWESTSKEERSETSAPSFANSPALPSSSSSERSAGPLAWLSSLSAALTSKLPSVAEQNEEAQDRSAERARKASSLSRR